jgi:hypothetical protein
MVTCTVLFKYSPSYLSQEPRFPFSPVATIRRHKPVENVSLTFDYDRLIDNKPILKIFVEKLLEIILICVL